MKDELFEPLIKSLGYDYVPGDFVMGIEGLGLFIGQEECGGIVWVLFDKSYVKKLDFYQIKKLR